MNKTAFLRGFVKAAAHYGQLYVHPIYNEWYTNKIPGLSAEDKQKLHEAILSALKNRSGLTQRAAKHYGDSLINAGSNHFLLDSIDKASRSGVDVDKLSYFPNAQSIVYDYDSVDGFIPDNARAKIDGEAVLVSDYAINNKAKQELVDKANQARAKKFFLKRWFTPTPTIEDELYNMSPRKYDAFCKKSPVLENYYVNPSPGADKEKIKELIGVRNSLYFDDNNHQAKVHFPS